jgi:hypothetical protein
MALPNPSTVPSIFDIAGAAAAPSANPNGVTSNWNGQIRECSIEALDGNNTSFGKLSFPVEECIVTFSQDVVQHKKPNTPGARLESMGLNPRMFHVRAPFLFGLQRASGETWSDLFPQTFILVFQILNDDLAPLIDFVHPTLGHFTVKPMGGSTVTTSTIRNGQILEFDLIEATQDTNTVTSPDSFSAAQSAANIFDSQITQLNPAPPSSITSINMTQLLQKVRGAIDSTSLFISQVGNTVNGAIHQVQMVEDSLNRLNTTATSGLSSQLQTIKASLYALKNGLIQQQSKLSVFVVPYDMTLAAVAATVHNPVEQIIRLNPAISKVPTIATGTQVIYQSTSSSTANAVAIGLGV